MIHIISVRILKADGLKNTALTKNYVSDRNDNTYWFTFHSLEVIKCVQVCFLILFFQQARVFSWACLCQIINQCQCIITEKIK